MPSNRRLFHFTIATSFAALTLASGCVSMPQSKGEKSTLTSGSKQVDSLVGQFFHDSVPVETILFVDTSGSARASGQLETLSAAVCKQIKEHTLSGDSMTLKPFAAASTTTHKVQIQDRMGVMGLCNDKNFANFLTAEAITRDVASEEGTNLFRTMQSFNANTASDTTMGAVITLIIHADDQAVEADKAIPLAQTAQRMESLLVHENTALVVFAIDGDLRRGLEASLQHPQALISPLSEDSIADSMQWAYDLARSPMPTPAAVESEAAQVAH